MNKHPIITIGYGNRSINDFVGLLSKIKVRYLIDLRSSPYSKYKPEFNKESLGLTLKENKLQYVYMGDSIGGLPNDRTCYTDDHVDYDKVKEMDFYKEGIARLVKAYEGGHSVAIMCSEGKPETCHRSKLIAVTLAELGVQVMHIDENDTLVSHEEIIRKIVSEQLDLFKKPTEKMKSRGKY